ncbi:alpha/beta hydrolase [Devosia sp. XJ19-1]|uniref:Alpha/beta hydrolase n=1 Tax=Devosia ureilytica TaxID=2952754 RepID=A0A9Q4FTJ0_9HYPH|nr:alpha/beta hydrolase [Devosia ureilytica]MCP8884430.1 alpha/beta hydrolase [Devosia ureilytica]MCP8888038.1 alpha/beta hydrolase [Devosia ureilytica]
MTAPRSTFLDAAGFEMHVTAWGDPGNPALVMWHGLARTGRDFDEAASALSSDYFVLCPDTLGRGLSAWARRGAADYTFATYGDMAHSMLDHFGIDQFAWVGTSMGGLLGITLAAGALRERISHLVINDVGPDIPVNSARRIADYVGNPPTFETVADYEAWLRKTYAPFGSNSEAFWRRMTDTSLRRTDTGLVTVHYDPAIVSLMGENKADLDVWDAYDAVTAQTLLIRGEHSDVLPPTVASAMRMRGPCPRLVTVPDCGHAPTLADDAQIDLLRTFLAT